VEHRASHHRGRIPVSISDEPHQIDVTVEYRAIQDGAYDALPEKAFMFVGDIMEAVDQTGG
jgi:F0F1-type ATP synthase beta subunit